MSDSLTGRADKWDRVLLERFRNDAYDTLIWILGEVEISSELNNIFEEIIDLLNNYDLDPMGWGDIKNED